MTDKRCGTCRHWGLKDPAGEEPPHPSGRLGFCWAAWGDAIKHGLSDANHTCDDHQAKVEVRQQEFAR